MSPRRCSRMKYSAFEFWRNSIWSLVLANPSHSEVSSSVWVCIQLLLLDPWYSCACLTWSALFADWIADLTTFLHLLRRGAVNKGNNFWPNFSAYRSMAPCQWIPWLNLFRPSNMLIHFLGALYFLHYLGQCGSEVFSEFFWSTFTTFH